MGQPVVSLGVADEVNVEYQVVVRLVEVLVGVGLVVVLFVDILVVVDQ